MNLINDIIERRGRFYHALGRAPTTIYIGKAEARELMRDAARLLHELPLERIMSGDLSGMELLGMEVVQTTAEHHLGFGLQL